MKEIVIVLVVLFFATLAIAGDTIRIPEVNGTVQPRFGTFEMQVNRAFDNYKNAILEKSLLPPPNVPILNVPTPPAPEVGVLIIKHKGETFYFETPPSPGK